MMVESAAAPDTGLQQHLCDHCRQPILLMWRDRDGREFCSNDCLLAGSAEPAPAKKEKKIVSKKKTAAAAKVVPAEETEVEAPKVKGKKVKKPVVVDGVIEEPFIDEEEPEVEKPKMKKAAKKAAAKPKVKVKITKKAKPKAKASKKPATTANDSPRGEVGASILAMLQRKGGATTAEIMEATGWTATHSVRGFISGSLRAKQGLNVELVPRKDGTKAYQIGK